MRVSFVRSLLFAVGFLFTSAAAIAQVDLSVTIAPPELQIDQQTICPGDGYIWTPGYWGWDNGGYFWVPGEWIMPPEIGFLWTPGYWGWGGRGFLFNEGYWGPSVGFYGGVNYGYGYFGHGYQGGRWTNGHFFYNTTLNRVNVNVNRNVYNTRVNAPVNRVSYNGGTGGINVRATAQESSAARDRHVAPVAAQMQHVQAARSAPQQKFSAPRGAAPATASAPSRAVAASASAARPATPVHPNDLPSVAHPAAPNTGNPKLDQKYQKQQQQLITTQTQDRVKLQQRQNSEHQQLAKQPTAAAVKAPQMEQRHQQQTQQLQQKHTQQTQQMQQRQQPAAAQRGGAPRGGGRP